MATYYRRISMFDLEFYLNNHAVIEKAFESMRLCVCELQRNRSLLADNEKKLYEQRRLAYYRFEVRFDEVLRTYLTPIERKIIVDHYFKGVSYASIRAERKYSHAEMNTLIKSAKENIVDNFTQR